MGNRNAAAQHYPKAAGNFALLAVRPALAAISGADSRYSSARCMTSCS
jgi:hypothetical protein